MQSLRVLLYGSLAKTGKGHGTDIAVQLGISGEDPVTISVNSIGRKMEDITNSKKIFVHGTHEITFDPQTDIEFFVF